MHNYQREFINFSLHTGALQFGNYTLKSGRTSPYFFNTGLFANGEAASKLGKFYADAIINSNLKFDMLFGPAYKGIPLVSLTAAALYEYHNINVPFTYNRKEIKDHGEGGNLVGPSLNGKVLIIDDVITAGTAIKEANKIITLSGAQNSGIVISIDREEKNNNLNSAKEEIEIQFQCSVISIATITNIIEILKEKPEHKSHLKLMINYRNTYGI
tara:strand:- start:101 stop:742 length:642 start_codon:yes stop_codon:yes gene_type:complete